MSRRRISWLGVACFAVTAPPVLFAQTSGSGAAAHPCDSETAATKLECRAAYDAVTAVVRV